MLFLHWDMYVSKPYLSCSSTLYFYSLVAVAIRVAMETETNNVLRSYLRVYISSDDDDIAIRQLTYDIL